MRIRHPISLALSCLCTLAAGAAGAGPDQAFEPFALQQAARPMPPAVAHKLVRKYVPELVSFSLIDIDTKALAELVSHEEPVAIPFSPTEAMDELVSADVFLKPHALRSGEPFMRVLYEQTDGSYQDEWHDLPAAQEYTGEVVDAPDSVAAFIVDEQFLLGAMMVPRNEAGFSGWSFVEPLDQMLRRNGATDSEITLALGEYDHVVYNTLGVEVYMPIDDDEDTVPDPGDDTDGAGGATRAPVVTETISVYLVSDIDHFTQTGNDLGQVSTDQTMPVLWFDVWTSTYEPLYNGIFDIDIEIVGQATWASGGPSSTNATRLLEEAYFFTTAVGTPIPVDDIGHLHLMTGKNLDGNTIGKAWKIGGFDDGCGIVYELSAPCKQSLGQTGMSTMWQQILLLGHELGHVMGATHSQMVNNYCMGNQCGPTIMQSFISNNQVASYSVGNSANVAVTVLFECGDAC